MPEINLSDLSSIKNQRINLVNDIEKLENKIRNSPMQSSELQIYKQNAMQATTAKENSAITETSLFKAASCL
jgi:hypothetical protein